MKQFVTIFALVSFAVLCSVESRSITKREVDTQSLDPAFQEAELEDGENIREKRHQDVKFGVKNALLGFVFNDTASSTTLSPSATSERSRRQTKTTTDDIVIFEKDRPVSLDFPEQLFGSSFNLVTNLSETVGDFMINSALRAQRLLESMRPFLWKIFGKKGLVIEAITDKPIFSDGSET